MPISSAALRDEMREENKKLKARVTELEAIIMTLRREVSALEAEIDDYNYPRQ